MNAYSIGSDSPRWWWPSAAAGAVGAAAIAAILVLPASGSQLRDGTAPGDAPAPPRDPWFSTVDPAADRPCYALRAQAASLEHHPRCGQRRVVEPWSGSDVRRPGLDARP
jgi:hypothetical protein